MKKILIGFSITFSLIIFFSMATFNYSQASSPSSTDEIDSYLQSINVPENVLNGMSLHEKQTIYNSLTETGEEVQYCSHTEKYLNTSGNSLQTRDIPNMKFSVTAFEYTNNLQRHMIYPHYEWKYGAIDTTKDKFSFCLSYDAWEFLSTPTLKIPTASDRIRPATMDFSGASFDIPNIGAYEGTATIIARRVSNLMSHSIILGYVADKTSNGASIGVTFGPLDISYSGELGKVDTVTEMLSLTW